MIQGIHEVGEASEQADPFVALGRQFATPSGGHFAELAETVARSHTGFVLERFLATADGLPEPLYDFLRQRSRKPSYAEAWDPVLGHIAALERGGASALEQAVQWGLHLAATSGQPVSWSVRLPSARSFVVGRRLEGPSSSWKVRSDGDQGTVHLDDGRVVERSGPSAAADSGPAGAGVIPLVLAADLPSSYLDGVEAAPASRLSPAMGDSLDQALRLVAATGPELTTWVAAVLRQVLVLDQEAGRTKSGSRSDFPGLVHASLPESGLVLGENLVHEASHQYYHLARRLQPVDDGSDQRLYYSPAVKRPRPLDRLLLAFHAFGNVALYYNRVAEVDEASAGECRRQVARLVRPLEELRQPLLGNPALTPMGRALVSRLQDELGDAGILPGAAR